MSFVGIIANPASGKDIRRVVSHAIAIDNQQKVNIVRRMLLALYSSGIERIEIMPDVYGIGERALNGLTDHPELRTVTSVIDMRLEGTARDSQAAAQYFQEVGAGCIIVLGGDGTSRVVAKGAGDVPMLPISTGTNNVVPTFTEGTVAGLVAAYVAQHPDVSRTDLCFRHKKLVVVVNNCEIDSALVDVALLTGSFAGAKAVWDVDSLRQVFVTRANPVNIGISSVIGVQRVIGPTEARGAAVTILPDRYDQASAQITAPIAPGHLVRVHIGSLVDIEPGILYPLETVRPALLALDGEREIDLGPDDHAAVRLDLAGPWIIDVERTLHKAVADGMYRVK